MSLLPSQLLTSPEASVHIIIFGKPIGSARITVPAGTQGGQIFRLKGKGFPDLKGGGHGSLFATVHIKIPRRLNDEALGHLNSFFAALDKSAA